MEALQSKDIFVDQVPVERLEVPHIEDDAMALRNGPLVNGVNADQVEESVTSPARIGNALQ
jgi:hypothetical protein